MMIAMTCLASAGTRRLLDVTVDFGLVVLGLGMLLCLYRLLKGPHLSDRALAADTLAVHLIGLVLLVSVRSRIPIYLDGILVLSLLSFAGTVAAAQYIARPHATVDPDLKNKPAEATR